MYILLCMRFGYLSVCLKPINVHTNNRYRFCVLYARLSPVTRVVGPRFVQYYALKVEILNLSDTANTVIVRITRRVSNFRN